MWDPRDERLKWVDVDRGAIHTFDPATGIDETANVGQAVGCVALRASGGLLLALRDGFATEDDPMPRFLARVEADKPMNRMNDGKVDPDGRFWAGTMADNLERNAGALYRLGLDHRVRKMLSPVSISNGIDWSPDGRTLYFIDSLAGGVDAFDYDSRSGDIAGRRRVIDVPESLGLPDGMTVDATGSLWVALWGASCVRRYSPAGALTAVIDLPVTNVTSCAFGGPGLQDLFITTARADLSSRQLETQPSAGGVFVCRPGATGRSASLFQA